jgi:hypothetical protein
MLANRRFQVAKTKIPGYVQPARNSPDNASPSIKWIAAGIVVIVVLALGIAIALASGSSSTAGESVDVADVVRVAGEDLPAFQGPETEDPALGRTVPTLSGVGLDNSPVELSGGPRVIAVVAHWCPHCQAEVPRITELVETDQWPEQVGLQYVSTAQDRTKGNWSPAEWFARERVTAPVLVDDRASTAYQALGVQGFPFLVGVAADNKVAWRVSGEQSPSELLALAQSLVPSGTTTTSTTSTTTPS